MAAVTFSGFNNIDFNQVVTSIIAQERQPIASLEIKQQTLQTQNTAFGTLATKLTAAQTAIATLADGSAVASLTASSSDAGVGVSATAGTIEGTFEIVVSALARRQVTASTTTYASPDAIVSTGGMLTLTGHDGVSTSISVGASMTVKELVKAINLAAGAPVSASLVQSVPGTYLIVLTGRQSGAANTFTVGGDVASFGANVQDAENASFTVNGLGITSSTNTINDVVPGVSLTLSKADPDKTVTVTASRDTASATERVKTLVTAYNDLVGFINEQRTAAATGEASIARDPLVLQLKNSLRSMLLGEHANSGAHSRLAEVGLGFDRSGKMVLDEKVFDLAVSTGIEDVQSLFAGDDGEDGAFAAIGDLINVYTRSGGLLSDSRERLNAQASTLTSRIDSFEEQLERRRVNLQKEFQAADEAMSQLNAQVATLSSLSGQFRLF